MWFFRRRQKRQAEIQAIKEDLSSKANEAKKSTEKLNKLLKDVDLGVTGYIFYATGGDKRRGKK